MKSNNIILITIICSFYIGCTKNETKFIEDDDNNGLAIFSNKSNNVLSCNIATKPWRTVNRIAGIGFSNARTDYELLLFKNRFANNLLDTIQINWEGFYQGQDAVASGNVELYLITNNKSTHNFISSLNGKRFALDGTNGYFKTTAQVNGTVNQAELGKGFIYFNIAKLDSIAPNQYQGNISGLFECNFQNFSITKGRFDHQIESNQVFF